MSNGSLAAYEAFPSTSAPATLSRRATLGVRFVKVATRRLSVPVIRRGKVVDDLPPPRRDLIPFENLASYSGAFITGEDPIWLIASDHGPIHLYDHSDKSVYGFSAAATVGECLIQSKSVRFPSIDSISVLIEIYICSLSPLLLSQEIFVTTENYLISEFREIEDMAQLLSI